MRENPFSLVSVHPFTKAANDGLYVMYMRRYRQAKVLKYHGLTWDKFMALPADIATLMLKDCDEAIREESEHLTNTANELGKLEEGLS